MNKKGFTLIELLIAIAVFSIVSAVVYSAFKNEIQAYVNQKKFSSAVRQLRAVSYFLSMDFKTVGFDPVDSSEVKIEVAKKDYFSFVKINEDPTTTDDLKRIAYYKYEDQILRLTQNLSSGSIQVMPKDVDGVIQSPLDLHQKSEKLAKGISKFEVRYLKEAGLPGENSIVINQGSLDSGSKNSLSDIRCLEILLECEIHYWGKGTKTEKLKFLVHGRNLGI
ncbi:MAG: prepilin-type N-terminal cleavage/methylation domain-containing protein [Desulfobacteraceae bacterium]|nr:prepilin-type N-terminal cleavage/methylation domain-containing protein [Desulfobacteraceae bacterium]MCB9494617.1 prepilin-type N-terminal cleavage/methylation domain-containing protein [Desulfobacteraceae bacterium]